MKNSDFNYRGQVTNTSGTGMIPLSDTYNRPNQTIVNNYTTGNSSNSSNVSSCGGNLELKNILYTDNVDEELIDKIALEQDASSGGKYKLKWDFNYDPIYPDTLWFHQNIGINKSGDNELVFRRDGRFLIILSLDLELNTDDSEPKYNAQYDSGPVLFSDNQLQDDPSYNYLSYNVNVKVECFAKGTTTARTVLETDVSLGGHVSKNNFRIPFNFTSIAYDRLVISLEEVSKRTINDSFDNKPVKLKKTSNLQLLCLC